MRITAKRHSESPGYGARESEGHGRLGQGQVARGQCQKQNGGRAGGRAGAEVSRG